MALPDGILACKFLNNASISDQHQQLVRGTLTELTYGKMKEQLCKIFDDITISASSNYKDFIKVELKEEVLQATH